jgi:hypothetical protein
VRFISGLNPAVGVTLAPGAGSWSSLSDWGAKRSFTAVDRRQLLARLDRVPITRWGYKAQDRSIRHLGPTAQDFQAAFGLGETTDTSTRSTRRALPWRRFRAFTGRIRRFS